MHESKGRPTPPSTTLAPLISRIIKESQGNPIVATGRLHELCTKAEAAGHYSDALVLASAHVAIANEVKNGPALLLGLLDRARISFKTNQFENAITDSREALNLVMRERSLPPTHAAHIQYTASNRLGAALWRNGDLNAAERQLTETTSLARTRFGAGSVEAIKSLFDQAFLALELKPKEATMMGRVREIIEESRPVATSFSAQALELGRALHHHGLWDAASYTLDWATKITTSPLEKTEALLTIANIAAYKSDTRALLHYVEQAESLWMDVAPRPCLERHIARLRAIAALSEGREDYYKEQIALAQAREEGEELSIEERIQLHFTRAEALRNSGCDDLAKAEVEDAHLLVRRAVVSPLTRFNTFLQQGFCEYSQGNYHDSNRFIDEALSIVKAELDHNRILEARARSLRAHNFYSIFTFSEDSSPAARMTLKNALQDGELALKLLNEGELDPHTRKVILRLLSGVTGHLEMPWRQIQVDRELALLEAQFPSDPR